MIQLATIAAALLTLPEFGSVTEAAEVFRCGPKAVYSGIEAGTIPHIRLGRTLRVPIRAIVEEARKQAAKSDAPDMQAGGIEDGSPITATHHGR